MTQMDPRTSVIYETNKVSREGTNELIVYAQLIGLIGGISMLIVSLAIDGQFVGPWYIYLSILILSILSMVKSAKIHATVLKILKNGRGEFSIELVSKNHSEQMQLTTDNDYWYSWNVSVSRGIQFKMLQSSIILRNGDKFIQFWAAEQFSEKSTKIEENWLFYEKFIWSDRGVYAIQIPQEFVAQLQKIELVK